MTAPASAYASITFNEVAYAGTTASQYEEWVELYNDSSDELSLDGWKIYKGSTVLFTLKASVSSQSYVLVCRTTGTLPDPLGGTCNDKGAFGGSGLSNTGEHLTLKDSSGEVVDEIVPVDSKWPVPGVTKTESMQKGEGGWFKAAPTPGTENASVPEAPDSESGIPTPTGSAPLVTTQSTKEDVELVKPDTKYVARTLGPDSAAAGVPLTFSVNVRQDGKRDMVSGKFEWYMGDGKSYRLLENQAITHTYAFAGDYQITLVYYSNKFKEEPDSIHRRKISIVEPRFLLSASGNGGVIIASDSARDIDLADWKLIYGNHAFTFSKYTLLAKGASLGVSPATLYFRVEDITKARLVNPEGLAIAKGVVPKVEIPEPLSNEEAAEGDPVSLTGEVKQDKGVPELKATGELWADYKWYMVGGMAALVLLVSLAVRLYATGNSLPDEEEEFV